MKFYDSQIINYRCVSTAKQNKTKLYIIQNRKYNFLYKKLISLKIQINSSGNE